MIIKLIMESFRFAWNALKMNAFRTTLSLLGVTVGIFAIIGVFTVVDSLEKSIKDSLNFLGTGIIYMDKWPYGLGGEYPWWKYLKRPTMSYAEFKFLEKEVKNKSAIAVYSIDGQAVLKYKSNSFDQTTLIGGSYGYEAIFSMPIDKGRYFTEQETSSGRNVAILGSKVAETLFPNEDAVGKEIKIKNNKFFVIGVIKKEGESFLGFSSKDENCVIPYQAFRKLFVTGTGYWSEKRSTVGVKGIDEDIGQIELEYELKGLLRSKRGLRPKDDDNFAMNRPESLMSAIGGMFDVLGLAGWFIGGFSILVGGFGIANIMFVSVRERTNVIGIQKSLGAKNYFVLFQFLFESVFLSLLGGGAGLLIVYLLSFMSLGSLELSLTFNNIVLGLGVSAIIGILSGIIPAAIAARMDPVEAIRSA